MAFVPYHNITGSTGVTTELIKPGSNASGIQSILITNTHATNSATVTLFLLESQFSLHMFPAKVCFPLKNTMIRIS